MNRKCAVLVYAGLVLAILSSANHVFGREDAAKSEELKNIQGMIESWNSETRELQILNAAGGRETLTVARDVEILAGDRKVSLAVLKKGMKATVVYVQQEGNRIPGMGVPIIFTAQRILVDPSVKDEPGITPRFIDNGDGTVTDTKTRLMWQKGDNGKEVAFEEAQSYCKTLSLGGHKDWRLPKKEEKDTAVVVELMMAKRSKDRHADCYWSTDPTVLLTFNYPATHLLLSDVLGVTKDARAYVRAIRQVPQDNITASVWGKVEYRLETAVEGRDFKVEGGMIANLTDEPFSFTIGRGDYQVFVTRVVVVTASDGSGKALPDLVGKSLRIAGAKKSDVKTLNGRQVQIEGIVTKGQEIEVISVKEATPDSHAGTSGKAGTAQANVPPQKAAFAIAEIKPTLAGHRNKGTIHGIKEEQAIWLERPQKQDAKLVLAKGGFWAQSMNNEDGSLTYLDSGAKIRFRANGTIVEGGLMELSPDTKILVCREEGIPRMNVHAWGSSDWFTGNIDYEGSIYSIVGTVPLGGWTFESDRDDPLVFTLQKDKGFVYVSGKGRVLSRDGKTSVFGQ